jgi:hypothetical protein
VVEQYSPHWGQEGERERERERGTPEARHKIHPSKVHPPVTYSWNFYHLPAVPSSGDQGFSICAFRGHLTFKPKQ